MTLMPMTVTVSIQSVAKYMFGIAPLEKPCLEMCSFNAVYG